MYLLPDGALHGWRLSLRGALARLDKSEDPRDDAGAADSSPDERSLMMLIHQKDAQIADLTRRLRELGMATERVDGMKIVAARVVRLGPDNTLDTFTIDAGSREGVAPGQAVVVGEAMAGVVVRAEADASLVLSLSSPGCYISARLGEPDGSPDRPRILGAVQGGGGGDVSAVVFSSDTAAKEGWVAMTSGLEPAIPEGLILGTLQSRPVEGGESGTMEAALRPEADLSSLDFVAVLRRE